MVFARFFLSHGNTKTAHFRLRTGRESDDESAGAEVANCIQSSASSESRPYAEADNAVMSRLTDVGPLLAYQAPQQSLAGLDGLAALPTRTLWSDR